MSDKLAASSSQPVTESMRNAYGDALAELGSENKSIVVLDADLSTSTQTCRFAKKFPERFFDVGVAEQNLIATAAGLALSGKTVFASSFAVFAVARPYNQLRDCIAYQNLDVKVIATHAGLTVGPDGASHQMLEDLALMSVLPNFRVFVPADARETKWLTKALTNFKVPAYMRISRMSVENVYAETEQPKGYNALKTDVLRNGKDVSIVACGLLVKEALKAADTLAKKKISAEVLNMHCIKPIDTAQLLKSAKNCGAIVTAEEHQAHGGLGGIVSEFLGENYPVPVQRVAVKDTFGESGEPADLMKKYGLTEKDIIKAVQNVVKRK